MTNEPARERDVVAEFRQYLNSPWREMSATVQIPFTLGDLRELLEAPSPKPDTDVVERVARAIDPHAFNDPTGDSYVEARICRAFEKARAAIAALNASTPEIQRMREALNWAETYDPQMVAQIRDRAALKQDEENHDD